MSYDLGTLSRKVFLVASCGSEILSSCQLADHDVCFPLVQKCRSRQQPIWVVIPPGALLYLQPGTNPVCLLAVVLLHHFLIPIFQRIRFLFHSFPAVCSHFLSVKPVNPFGLGVDLCPVMPPELADLKMGFRHIDNFRLLPYHCNAVGIDVMVLVDMVFVPKLFRLPSGYQTDIAMEFLRQNFYQVRNNLVQYG